jgi:cytochrome c oxidase subunit 2
MKTPQDQEKAVVVTRRGWLVRAGGAAALPVLAPLAGLALAADGPQEQVVQLTAQRFHYTPSEVTLVAGRPVLLEIRALDFPHGFHVPDLKQRIDLVPGQVVKLKVQFDKPGRYTFLCDNFCGDHHEDMNGRFIVTAAS